MRHPDYTKGKQGWTSLALVSAVIMITLLAALTSIVNGIGADPSSNTPLDVGYSGALSPADDGVYESKPLIAEDGPLEQMTWWINGTSIETYENITININGDVNITENAGVIFKNCIIEMNNTNAEIDDDIVWVILGELTAYNTTFTHKNRGTGDLIQDFQWILSGVGTVTLYDCEFYAPDNDATESTIRLGTGGAPTAGWAGEFVAINSILNCSIDATNANDVGAWVPKLITVNTNLTQDIDFPNHGDFSWQNYYMHTISLENVDTTDLNMSIMDAQGRRVYDNTTYAGTWAGNGTFPVNLTCYIPEYITDNVMPNSTWFIIENFTEAYDILATVPGVVRVERYEWPLTVTMDKPGTWDPDQVVGREYDEVTVMKYQHNNHIGWGYNWPDTIFDAKGAEDYRLEDVTTSAFKMTFDLNAPRPINHTHDRPSHPWDQDGDLEDDDEDQAYGGGMTLEENTIVADAGTSIEVYRYGNFTLSANMTTSEEAIATYAWEIINSNGTRVTSFSGKYKTYRNTTLPVGLYTVTLTVTDVEGAQDWDSIAMRIVQRPTAAKGTGSTEDDDEDEDEEWDWTWSNFYEFWDGDWWVALGNFLIEPVTMLVIVIIAISILVILYFRGSSPIMASKSGKRVTKGSRRRKGKKSKKQ